MICAIIYEVLRGLLLNLLILFVINMAIFGQARNEWNLKLVSVPLTVGNLSNTLCACQDV